MVVKPELSRSAKILVGAGRDFEAASRMLETLTLDVVVGRDAAASAAGQAAVLTAVSTGRRSFAGGVRLLGGDGVPLSSPLGLHAATLDEAALEIGAVRRDGVGDRVISIGEAAGGAPRAPGATAAWFDGWRAGYGPDQATCGVADNPLAGAAAGALAVGAAFRGACGLPFEATASTSLWNPKDPAAAAPAFGEVFLPGAVYLLGLGNLGQAYLWALSLLPYPCGALELVLQDADRVRPENWGTSVLVRERTYGALKTRVAEDWALRRGFRVRRVDRRLAAQDRLAPDDPRAALSGFDSIASRRLITGMGFDVVVDAGLGRTAGDYERYRVNVFDADVPMARHFEAMRDADEDEALHEQDAYRDLERRIGRCGMAEIAGAAAAAPYVSAVAACIAVARLIQVACGSAHCPSEVGRTGAMSRRRTAGWRIARARGVGATAQADAGAAWIPHPADAAAAGA